MTQPVAPQKLAQPPSLPRALLADKHFLAASVILAVTAAGWGAATQWLQFTMLKTPVAWPAGVRVTEDFRLLSAGGGKGLDEMGPLKRVRPNDELIRVDPNFQNWEMIKRSDLETLKIGTAVDEGRYADRKSNWYMVRYYNDSRAEAPVRTWRLELYYYTGEADTVPHIPDVCAQAGGATILASDTVRWQVPQAPEGWARQGVPFHRTQYQMADGRKSAAYYTFSMNGQFSDSSTWVRWELLNPFIRFAYFAKIQFSPAAGSSQGEETDRAAEDFMRLALPEVLKALPSAQDVKAMEQRP
jgi:hypothetical protein